MRRVELPVLALVLASAIGVALAVRDGWILFTRPMWVDEVQTVLLARRPTPITVIADLGAGTDHGPPLLALTAWTLRVLAGALSPVLLRAVALATVIGALVVVYAVLRRSFGRLASATGIVAVVANDLVVAHMFEGRFYGPWLLLAASFAWCLRRDAPSAAQRWLVAISAVLLALVHWYGIISLSLMTAAVLAVDWREWRGTARRLAPAAAGVGALALCVPLAVGQRNALTVSTWLPEFRLDQLKALAIGFWTAAVPVVAAAVAIAAIFVASGGRARGGALARVAVREPGLVALMSLALMPVALAVVSAAGQPSMLGRYALPAVLAWAPLVAFAATLAGRVPSLILIAYVATLWYGAFGRETVRKRTFAIGIADFVGAYRQAQSFNAPVVFQSMHTLYPVVEAARADWSSVSFLDVPDSTIETIYPPDWRRYQWAKGPVVERDVVRVHARRFGFPRLLTQAMLDSTLAFVFVSGSVSLPRGMTVEDYLRELFPHHARASAAPGVWLLRRAK